MRGIGDCRGYCVRDRESVRSLATEQWRSLELRGSNFEVLLIAAVIRNRGLVTPTFQVGFVVVFVSPGSAEAQPGATATKTLRVCLLSFLFPRVALKRNPGLRLLKPFGFVFCSLVIHWEDESYHGLGVRSMLRTYRDCVLTWRTHYNASLQVAGILLVGGGGVHHGAGVSWDSSGWHRVDGSRRQHVARVTRGETSAMAVAAWIRHVTVGFRLYTYVIRGVLSGCMNVKRRSVGSFGAGDPDLSVVSATGARAAGLVRAGAVS